MESRGVNILFNLTINQTIRSQFTGEPHPLAISMFLHCCWCVQGTGTANCYGGPDNTIHCYQHCALSWKYNGQRNTSVGTRQN